MGALESNCYFLGAIMVTAAFGTNQFLSTPTYPQDGSDGISLDLGEVGIAIGGESGIDLE
jgi:hypothetical protein